MVTDGETCLLDTAGQESQRHGDQYMSTREGFPLGACISDTESFKGIHQPWRADHWPSGASCPLCGPKCSPAHRLPTGSRLPPCREQIKWVKASDGIPVVLVGTSVTWSWFHGVSAGQNLTQNCSVPCSDVLAQMHQVKAPLPAPHPARALCHPHYLGTALRAPSPSIQGSCSTSGSS